MRTKLLYLLLAFFAITLPALAVDVQVLYCTGNVSVVANDTAHRAQIGMTVDSSAMIVLARGATLQLSVNGKVMSFSQPAKIRVSDAIRRIGEDENPAVLKALRRLGARNGDGLATVNNTPLRNRRALTQFALSTENMTPNGEPILVMLEPRATAVLRGPLHFRWLCSPEATGYVVTVRNRFDEVVFRAETTDTSLVWEGADLFAESEYSWTLALKDDSTTSAIASFHRLNDIEGMRVEGGESRIRLELGSENPALPLVLGAYLAESGCYGEASRYLTAAAQSSPEYFDQFMSLVGQLYRQSMRAPEAEVRAIYDRGELTSAR